jgi:sialate O-acetylesterase
MSVNLYDSLKRGEGIGVRSDVGNDKNPGTGWPIAGGSNPHPPNKQIVADRLADQALVFTYGKDLKREVEAPVYVSHELKGGKVLVTFKNVGEGLKTDDGAAPDWFELSDGSKQAENDKAALVYHRATARIVSKDTVELSAADVVAPKHVRLAWHMLARQNLQSSAGLPAVNFRTDTQPTKQR